MTATDIALLTQTEAKRELAKLAMEIAHHDALYHGQDEPEITDAAYDALVARNREIEERFPDLVRSDSPSKRVGVAVKSAFDKITHAKPMLSLGNVFTDDDLADFMGRVRRFLNLPADTGIPVTAEPKIDGLSLSLRYENRQLVHAATRGDGQVGENVTANVLTIKDIPKALPDTAPDIFEVRGEVYLAKSDFIALNERQTAAAAYRGFT